MYARKNAVPEKELRARKCVSAVAVRALKARDAVSADGRVRRVGTVSVERV